MSSRRNFIKQSVLGAGALAFLPHELIASGDWIRLTVMHTNDLHCHIDPFPDSNAEFPGRGGMVRLASIISKARTENPNFLLLDAGDMFQGTPYFNYFKGELMLKLMSQMGYDGGTIGNHEFDNGLQGIASALQFAKFPIITSNYDFSDTILSGRTSNYQVLNRGGIKIGLYGLGIELDGLVGQSNYGNTKYLDPLDTALKMERLLKMEHKCDLVICLSHLGIGYEGNKICDKTLAPETQFTDLIIGGHTHTFLEKPLELKNKQGKLILVNQAGWASLMTGKIEFVFDRTGKRNSFTSVVNHL